MKRLIDANIILKEGFCKDCILLKNGECVSRAECRWKKTVDAQKTIDAVQVVRCKECANRDTRNCPAYMSIYGSMEDGDFCSYGERKDGAE